MTSGPIENPEVQTSPGPFEGPEKLLELWFAPSPDDLPSLSSSNLGLTRTNLASEGDGARSGSGSGKPTRAGMKGLRTVPKEVWEEMLDIVKCKVLSFVEGDELDAYLLSESSLFVAPHLLILKTCGTTMNLLGLYRILEIAREYCGFMNVWRCFYSRKSFFFPERQQGVHRDWRDEVGFLDSVFGSNGTAYTVGPMNRDHWLLYLTSPNTQPLLPSDSSLVSSTSFHLSLPALDPSPSSLASSSALGTSTPTAVAMATGSGSTPIYHDTTVEILMSYLSPSARAPFFHPDLPASTPGHELGAEISRKLAIDQLFSPDETVLDSFGFDPCGYSANAVIGSGSPHTSTAGAGPGADRAGGGYFTIHVTPEEGWSYASFECNVPLPSSTTSTSSTTSQEGGNPRGRPDLTTLVRKVVDIFQPSRLSITLFVSTPTSAQTGSLAVDEQQNWVAFGKDLLGQNGYERKDRIGYEFDGYDLVFACFEKRGWKEPEKQAMDEGGRAQQGLEAMERMSISVASAGEEGATR